VTFEEGCRGNCESARLASRARRNCSIAACRCACRSARRSRLIDHVGHGTVPAVPAASTFGTKHRYSRISNGGRPRLRGQAPALGERDDRNTPRLFAGERRGVGVPPLHPPWTRTQSRSSGPFTSRSPPSGEANAMRDPGYERSLLEWNPQSKRSRRSRPASRWHCPSSRSRRSSPGPLAWSALHYYRVHKRSHTDAQWAREHLPWHYAHHLGATRTPTGASRDPGSTGHGNRAGHAGVWSQTGRRHRRRSARSAGRRGASGA